MVKCWLQPCGNNGLVKIKRNTQTWLDRALSLVQTRLLTHTYDYWTIAIFPPTGLFKFDCTMVLRKAVSYGFDINFYHSYILWWMASQSKLSWSKYMSSEVVVLFSWWLGHSWTGLYFVVKLAVSMTNYSSHLTSELFTLKFFLITWNYGYSGHVCSAVHTCDCHTLFHVAILTPQCMC